MAMKQGFSDKFFAAISCLSENEKQSKLLVAVSGGADSMAMLHALCSISLNLVVAHVNYKQRGEESDADEQLVKQFCSENALPFRSINWPYGKGMSSFQEKAREFRYAFFKKLMEQEHCSLLLTAHHQNDRVESFLFNISRGAGPAGMDALAEKNAKVFRPLFRMNKQEIEAYLLKHSVPFRVDKSNLENNYRRNFIRLDVLPKIEEIHPGALSNIVHLLDRNKMAAAEIKNRYKQVEDECLSSEEQSFGTVFIWNVGAILKKVIDVNGFLYHVLKSKAANVHHKDIDNLAAHFGQHHSESKVFLFGEVCVEFFGECMYSYRQQISTTAERLVANLDELLALVPDSLTVECMLGAPTTFHKGKLYLDADALRFPLMMRTPKDGDKIKLFGLRGRSKKVSDLLTQEKLAQWQKKTTCLIFDADNELVIFNWQRHSEKLAINKATNNAIILS